MIVPACVTPCEPCFAAGWQQRSCSGCVVPISIAPSQSGLAWTPPPRSRLPTGTRAWRGRWLTAATNTIHLSAALYILEIRSRDPHGRIE